MKVVMLALVRGPAGWVHIDNGVRPGDGKRGNRNYIRRHLRPHGRNPGRHHRDTRRHRHRHHHLRGERDPLTISIGRLSFQVSELLPDNGQGLPPNIGDRGFPLADAARLGKKHSWAPSDPGLDQGQTRAVSPEG